MLVSSVSFFCGIFALRGKKGIDPVAACALGVLMLDDAGVIFQGLGNVAHRFRFLGDGDKMCHFFLRQFSGKRSERKGATLQMILPEKVIDLCEKRGREELRLNGFTLAEERLVPQEETDEAFFCHS